MIVCVYLSHHSVVKQHRTRVYRSHFHRLFLSGSAVTELPVLMTKTVSPNAVLCSQLQYLYPCLTSALSSVHIAFRNLEGLHHVATFSVNVRFGLGLKTAS